MAERRSGLSRLSESPVRNLAGGVVYMIILILLATLAYVAFGW